MAHSRKKRYLHERKHRENTLQLASHRIPQFALLIPPMPKYILERVDLIRKRKQMSKIQKEKDRSHRTKTEENNDRNLIFVCRRDAEMVHAEAL